MVFYLQMMSCIKCLIFILNRHFYWLQNALTLNRIETKDFSWWKEYKLFQRLSYKMLIQCIFTISTITSIILNMMVNILMNNTPEDCLNLFCFYNYNFFCVFSMRLSTTVNEHAHERFCMRVICKSHSWIMLKDVSVSTSISLSFFFCFSFHY